MKEVNIYRVYIDNTDRTTIYFVAKSKFDAACKYGDWLKEHGADYGVDECTDFDIKFSNKAYE